MKVNLILITYMSCTAYLTYFLSCSHDRNGILSLYSKGPRCVSFQYIARLGSLFPFHSVSRTDVFSLTRNGSSLLFICGISNGPFSPSNANSRMIGDCPHVFNTIIHFSSMGPSFVEDKMWHCETIYISHYPAFYLVSKP